MVWVPNRLCFFYSALYAAALIFFEPNILNITITLEKKKKKKKKKKKQTLYLDSLFPRDFDSCDAPF